jgi:hypothetical protein
MKKVLKKHSTFLLAIGLFLNIAAASAQVPDRRHMAGGKLPRGNHAETPRPTARLLTGTITSSQFEADITTALLATRLQVSTTGAGETLQGPYQAVPNSIQKWQMMRRELLEGCMQEPDPEKCVAEVRAAMDRMKKMYTVGYYSFIKWGPVLKLLKPDMKDKILDIPYIGKNLPGPGGELTFLINNLHAVVNVAPIFGATVGDGGLNFSIDIKSDNPTIKCVGSSLCPGNINLTDSKLLVKLRNLTVTSDGKFAYGDAVVSLTGHIDFTGVLDAANTIIDLESKLRNVIESKIKEQLFTKDVKEGFDKALRQLIRRRLPGGKDKIVLPVRFNSIEVQGSNLVVGYTDVNRR